MSQNYCPSDAEIYSGINRPQGNGGPIENTRNNANPLLERMQFANQHQAEAANHMQLTQAVRQSINVDELPGTPMNAGDRQFASTNARQLVNLMERAEQAEVRRQTEWQAAFEKVSGTTVGETSKWLDITTGVSSRFNTVKAKFQKWSLLNFGSEGGTVIDNPLVRALEEVEPRTRGQLQIYTQMYKDMTAEFAPIADRLGFDVKDVLEGAGHYANAVHMAERNAVLLARWESQLAQLRSRGERADTNAIVELETNIANLRENLDNPNPPAGLISGGYTNGQARAIIEQTVRPVAEGGMGLTQIEADAIATRYREISRQILQDRVEAGLVSPETIANFPDFEAYIPIKTKFENTTGAANNANIFNPGKYYAIDGTADAPDSAYHTVMHYARRAANEVGMQELGTQLSATIRSAEMAGRDVGLRQYDYQKLVRAKYEGNQYERAWANSIENGDNGGGIVVDVPVFDAEGNQSPQPKRMFITFDKNWRDPVSNISGAELNQSMMGTMKTAAGFNRAAQATSMYGQMFTRFNPAFAPVNTIRDLVERSSHLMGRDYYMPDGSAVRGSSLLPVYFTNVPRAGKLLYSILRGTAEPGSYQNQLWQEYVRHGLHQQYTRGQNTPRRTLSEVIDSRGSTDGQGFIASRLNTPELAGLKQRLDTAGNARRAVVGVLDQWNDYFNNIASFNHFMTLREAGVPTSSAASGTLEMMNLYQRGEWTPALRTLFPFVNPTVQSGVAIARTLGLAPNARGEFRVNRRGTLGVLGAYATYMMLMPLIREGMGTDEETGMSRYDQMSLSDLQRFVPIGLGGGDFFKLPTGFGLPQLAVTLAVGSDRVMRGVMAPEDFVAETLFVIGKNVSPTNWPEFSAKEKPAEWLAQAFTPTLVRPIADIALNTNFMGRRISTAENDGFRSRSDQGRLSTQREYHQMAQWLYRNTGVDLAPEQVKSLLGNLTVGPLRLLKGFVEEDSLRTSGVSQTSAEALGPWLSALGGSLMYGRTYDTGRSLYYQALDQYRGRIRRDGIKITDRSYGSNPQKRETYQRTQLQKAGWPQADIEDFMTLMRTESALRSNNSKFAAEIRPIWLSSEELGPIRTQFESLANRQASLYNGAVTNLNYYSGIR